MRKQERISTPVMGGASLLVIFAALCLCMLSLLSLSAVLAEKRMAEASLEAVAAYYGADLEAQALFARLRGGERIPGAEAEEDVISFSCVVSENQHLQVRLQKNADIWTVLRWQLVTEEDAYENTLPVWDGT